MLVLVMAVVGTGREALVDQAAAAHTAFFSFGAASQPVPRTGYC